MHRCEKTGRPNEKAYFALSLGLKFLEHLATEAGPMKSGGGLVDATSAGNNAFPTMNL